MSELQHVPDGAVSSDQWPKGHKVLHLLREPSKPGQLGEDLQGVLADGKVKYRIWKRVAARTQAIRQGLPPNYADLDESQFPDAFLECAVINLNPTIDRPARPKSDEEPLARDARAHFLGVKRSVLILEPHLILCGGSFELFRTLLKEHGEVFTEGSIWLKWHGILCVSLYHPSNTNSHVENHKQVVERVRQAQKEAAA